MTKFALLLLVACQAPAASTPADPAQKRATQSVASAAMVPADYVITPNGYFHRSCVQGLASGATVDANGTVTNDPHTTQMAPCVYPRVVVQAPAGAEYTPPSSWVLDSLATSPAPVSRMTANFTVPQNPSVVGDQVIFFFPGLRPADGSSVLQPVLQWGSGSAAGGGQSWAVASWACAAVSGGSCPYSTLIDVNPGDQLSGEIASTNCNGSGACDWTITTTDTTTKQSTTLNATNLSEAFVLMFGGALESYNVNQCGDYPSDQKATFTNTDFYDLKGALITPDWSAQYDVRTYCSLGIATTNDSTVLTFQKPIILTQ